MEIEKVHGKNHIRGIEAMLLDAETQPSGRRRGRADAGGPGDKIFPPTYVKKGKAETKHAIEKQAIDGEETKTGPT